MRQEAEWIGAKLQINDKELYVKVMVSEAKVDEWKRLLEGLEPAVRWIRNFSCGLAEVEGWREQPLGIAGADAGWMDFYVDASPWGGSAVRLKAGRLPWVVTEKEIDQCIGGLRNPWSDTKVATLGHHRQVDVESAASQFGPAERAKQSVVLGWVVVF